MTTPAPEHGSLMVGSPDEAVARLLARVRTVPVERIPLARAPGRVLAQSIVTDRPSPPVAVSAMDGYAVNTGSLKAGRVPVLHDGRIGTEPPPLRPGSVSRIVTGAPIPAGTDAVVKREDVVEERDAIVITGATVTSLRPGTSIRKAGENAAPGVELVGPGRVIDPAVTSALASFGYSVPNVYRRVRVGILVTGDELVNPEAIPTPWQIRDSNGPVLAALLSPLAWIEVLPPRRSHDDPQSIRDQVNALLADSDALVVTGGASMGDRDFVPGVLADIGVEIVFHKVRQRPGKPALGAVMADGRLVLALPGNPVSVMATARRILIPALRRLGGLGPVQPYLVTLDAPDQDRIDLWWHRTVQLVAPGIARLVEGRGSGDIVSAARGDGFIEVPPGQGGPGPWAFYGWGL